MLPVVEREKPPKIGYDLPPGMIRAPHRTGIRDEYMPGFGNDFGTEALLDALPDGMTAR